MTRVLVAFIVLLAVFFAATTPVVRADVCDLPGITLSGVPTAVVSVPQLQACFDAIPFDATTRDDTAAALRQFFAVYPFTDISQNSGPPYYSQVDTDAFLSELEQTTYAGDYAMHSAIQRHFNSLNDAHTRFVNPKGYNNFFLIRPFFIGVYLDEDTGETVFTAAGQITVFGFGWSAFHNLIFSPSVDVSAHVGKRIVSINGEDPLSYIQKVADHYGTYRSAGVRLNDALKNSFLASQFDTAPIPTNLTTETYRFSDGTSVTVDLPVLGRPLQFNSVATLSALNFPPAPGRRTDADRRFDHDGRHHDVFMMQPKTPLEKEIEKELRSFVRKDAEDKVLRGIGKRIIDVKAESNESAVVFGTFTAQDGVEYPVLQINSFAFSSAITDQPLWVVSFQQTVKAAVDWGETNSKSELIIDVSGNGGGLVCLSVQTMIALIKGFSAVADQVKPTSNVAFRLEGGYNSSYYDLVRYRWNETGLFNTPCTLTPITDESWFFPTSTHTRGGTTGLYTTPTTLNCDTPSSTLPFKYSDPAGLNWTPSYFYSKIIVVTDGTCGSACSLFLSTIMAFDTVTVLSFGGRPDEVPDTSSFLGGYVTQWSDLVAAGNTLTSVTGLTLVNLPTTASMGLPQNEAYIPGGSIPREFYKMPGDAILPLWPRLAADITDTLYEAAIGYFANALLTPDTTADCTPIVLGDSDTSESAASSSRAFLHDIYAIFF